MQHCQHHEEIARLEPEDIFDKTHKRHHAAIFNYANYIVNDEGVARDIVADVFIKVWNRREQFETVTNMRAYSFICTRNDCFNYLNAEKIRNNSLKELNAMLLQQHRCESACWPEKDMEAKLRQAFDTLDSTTQQILFMGYYENLTYQQMADKLQLTVRKIRYRKERGLQLLKFALSTSLD